MQKNITFSHSIRYCFFIYIVFSSVELRAVDIPYEKCSWQNKSFTERLVNETQDLQTTAACSSATCATQGKNANNNQDNTTTIQPTKEALKIPPECFFASAVRSIKKKPAYVTYTNKDGKKFKGPNYYYCDSMADQKPKGHTFPLNDKGEKQKINPQPPCHNEDYIMMTYHAFHNMADCFGFDNKDKKHLFNLFNHESSFILNNKSGTGARCYGQVVQLAITEVNKRIYVSDVSDEPKSRIYKDIEQKCPDTLSRVRIPDKIRSGATDSSWKRSRLRRKGKVTVYESNYNGVMSAGEKMDCALTQHADTCFFYAMYNIKLNEIQLEKTLSPNSSLHAEYDLPAHLNFGKRLLYDENGNPKAEYYSTSNTAQSQKLRQLIKDFQLPLQLNEMLIIKGPITTNKSGKPEEQTWLMRDDIEIYEALRNKNYSIDDLTVKKVTVFDMEDEVTKRDILYQAYNGGISVVSEVLKGFIRDRKLNMSSGSACKTNPLKEDCANREILLNNGKPLPFDHKKFAEYQRLSNQVREFPSQIIRDQDYLNNTSDQKDNPTPLANHLYKLKGIKPKDSSRLSTGNAQEEKKAIDNFIKAIKGKCGKS